MNRMVNQQVWPHDHVTCAFDGLSRDVQNLEDGTGGKVIAQMENFASITIDDFFSVVVLLAFSGQSIYKPNFFMNYWVHAVKNPTSLWVGRLTKCANPTSQWHFGSIVLVFFFVVWIVVTVSVVQYNII